MLWAYLALALSSAAMAAEPEVAVEKDGTVEVRLTVDASTSDIRLVLADTDGVYSKLNADIYKTEAKKTGTCEEVQRQTRGVWRPFNFRSLRCPTKAGFTETLIDSPDLAGYDSTWELKSTQDGTEIIYRVRTQLNSGILPMAMVQKGTLAGAKETVVNLARELLARRVPSQ
jgi:hypothetical protein